MEMPQLVTLVEPLFNQLTVFDPRFPHGVRPVHGTRDPMTSRLVLHGEGAARAGAVVAAGSFGCMTLLTPTEHAGPGPRCCHVGAM